MLVYCRVVTSALFTHFCEHILACHLFNLAYRSKNDAFLRRKDRLTEDSRILDFDRFLEDVVDERLCTLLLVPVGEIAARLKVRVAASGAKKVDYGI